MQPYNKAVMTDKGIELLNKAQAGLCQIEITRMAIGDGDYLAAEKKEEYLKEQLSLKNEKNRYPISSKGVASDNSIIITSIFSNQDPITYEVLVEEGYCISEIGVFAKESGATEEILYSIAVAEETGDYMPAFEGSNPAQIIQSYQIAVNNMETAEVVINYAGAAMLASEGQAHVADQERHITAEERECWNNKLDTNSNISKRQVGLENVDNTSDAEKPISIVQQVAIDEAKTAAANAQSTANAAQTAANSKATYEAGACTLYVGKSSQSEIWIAVTGRYIKIGKLCYVVASTTITTLDETEGYLCIRANSLPFAKKDSQSVIGSIRLSATPVGGTIHQIVQIGFNDTYGIMSEKKITNGFPLQISFIYELA